MLYNFMKEQGFEMMDLTNFNRVVCSLCFALITGMFGLQVHILL